MHMLQATSMSPYSQPIHTTKNMLLKTPLYLMRRSAESELLRVTESLDETQKKLVEVTTQLKESDKKTQEATAVLTKDKERLTKEVSDLQAIISKSKASTDSLTAQAAASLLTIEEKNHQITRLEERLGKHAKPTSFERIFHDEDSEKEQDPLATG